MGSDDLPENAERRALEDTTSCLEAGVLRLRVVVRHLPLERVAAAHETFAGGQSGGRVALDIQKPT